jgi:hypothetical protein
MTMRLALILAATALAATSAIAQQAPAKADPRGESCDAHKFETTVHTEVEGKIHSSKVKLCGKIGQTDADWATTLRDAAGKVETNEGMPRAVKDQIISALKLEVANIEAAIAAPNAPPVATASTIAGDLPTAIVPPAARLPEYTSLPPLPTAPKASRLAAANLAPARPAPPPPPKPRLTFGCFTPGEPGSGGPCFTLGKSTQLTVHADEDLAAGYRLHFVRHGNDRGEVALGKMRKGQSLRFKAPKDLCGGIVRSTVEIQILAGLGQLADTRGPYDLRC